eukprot:PhF_6_TR40969/c0_g1_i1/m.62015
MLRSARFLKTAAKEASSYDLTSLYRLWPTPSFVRPLDVPALIGTYSAAAAKYPNLPEAYIGRAQCFILQGEYENALTDVQNALKLPITDFELKRFAGALLARCQQGLLGIAEYQANANVVEGGAVDAQRQRTVQELTKTLAENPSDFGIALTLGELQVVTAPHEAERTFTAVQSQLNSEISRRKAGSESVVGSGVSSPVSLFMKNWRSNVDVTCNLSEKSFQTDVVRNVFNSYVSTNKTAPSLTEFATEKNIGNLSPVELEAILRISAQAHIGDNGFTRPLEIGGEKRKTWDGDNAMNLEDRMDQFSGNVTRRNASQLSKINRKVSALTSSHTVGLEKPEALKGTLESVPKDGDVLEAVLKVHGQPNQSCISSEDKAFFDLVNEIETSFENIPTGVIGNDRFLTAQKTLATDLLEQQLERARVGLGLAKFNQGNEEEARGIFTEVIERGAYFEMHRVLEARAKASQALGDIDSAEKDFRELYRLRLSTTNDIPSVDVNRYRIDF